MRFLNRRSLTAIALLLLACGIYWRWMNFNLFVFFGDWSYNGITYLAERMMPSAWDGWHGFGKPNILLWRAPLDTAYGMFARFGFGQDVSDKFLVFWPIMLLLPVSGYLVAKKVAGSVLGGIAGAIVFAYNTYFLAIDTQGHELITVAAAFGMLALWAFMEACDRESRRFTLLSSLSLAVCGFVDFRIAYLFAPILAAYAAFAAATKKRREPLVFATAIFSLFAALNAFWILPSLAAGNLTDNTVLDRGLFGDQFSNLSAALTLFHPFWNGAQPVWFQLQSIPAAFWAIPALALAGLYARRRDGRVLFFAAIAIIGVFLAKQAEPPFANVYDWLFRHVPGFSAFREATKFYVLIALGYGCLIAALVDAAVSWRPRYLGGRAAGMIVFLAAITLFLPNTLPLIDGRIGAMFVSRATSDVGLAVDAFVEDHARGFRTIGVPRNVDWRAYSLSTPRTANENLIAQLNLLDGGVAQLASQSFPIGAESFADPRTPRLLDLGAVRYVYLPPTDDVSGDPYRFYAPREQFVAALDSLPYLKKVDTGIEGITLYENPDARPFVYATDAPLSLSQDVPFSPARYAIRSATRYDVTLNAPAHYLNFAENYAPGWSAYKASPAWWRILVDRGVPAERNEAGFITFPSDHLTGATITMTYRPQAFVWLGAGIGFLFFIIAVIAAFARPSKRFLV